MVCCIAALAVLAACGTVFRRPWAWIRGREAGSNESTMPPAARYDVTSPATDLVGSR